MKLLDLEKILVKNCIDPFTKELWKYSQNENLIESTTSLSSKLYTSPEDEFCIDVENILKNNDELIFICAIDTPTRPDDYFIIFDADSIKSDVAHFCKKPNGRIKRLEDIPANRLKVILEHATYVKFISCKPIKGIGFPLTTLITERNEEVSNTKQSLSDFITSKDHSSTDEVEAILPLSTNREIVLKCITEIFNSITNMNDFNLTLEASSHDSVITIKSKIFNREKF